MKRLFLCVICMLIVKVAFTYDLGARGDAWPIEERDIKQLLIEQAEKTHWDQISKTLLDQAHHISQHFPVSNLAVSNTTVTQYYDPSVRLRHDISVQGVVIYRRGVWVNPLKMHRPQTNMLFFDGNSKAQRTFALTVQKHYPYRIMLVMTAGDVVKLGKQIQRPVYFGYPSILKRFHIHSVPSLLGVGEKAHQYDLAVTTFEAPYDVQDIVRCWHGCMQSSGGTHAS